MTSKLDLSLDDIIKSRPSFRGNNNRRREQGNPGRNDRRQNQGGLRSGPYGRPNLSPRRQAGGPVDSGRIIVSNLHYNVSESDIRELFSQVGSVRSASLNYDSRGASQGTGEVIFSRPNDAMTAIKKYNGVTLDGRAMKIAIPFIPGSDGGRGISGRVGPNNFSSGRDSRGPQNGRHSGGRSHGRSNGRRRQETRPTKTADELDAELDAYLSTPVEKPITMEE